MLVRWIEMHVVYGRVWTPAFALRADLVAMLEALRLPDHEGLVEQYVPSSLWWYARFQLAVSRHIEAVGGLWLLADRDAETRVANAIYQIEWHPPLSQRQDSWLRVTLRRDEELEFLPFADALAEPEGQEILHRWRTWIEACDCALESPSPRCEVHRTVDACKVFCDLIEEDWEHVVGRSRAAALDIQGIDTSDLIERFWPQARKRASPLTSMERPAAQHEDG